MSLDTILAARSLAPCAVKIDVEGSELEVLKGEATGGSIWVAGRGEAFTWLRSVEDGCMNGGI